MKITLEPTRDTAERYHEVAMKPRRLLVAPLCGATLHHRRSAPFSNKLFGRKITTGVMRGQPLKKNKLP